MSRRIREYMASPAFAENFVAGFTDGLGPEAAEPVVAAFDQLAADREFLAGDDEVHDAEVLDVIAPGESRTFADTVWLG